jgi:hypothetical protein
MLARTLSIQRLVALAEGGHIKLLTHALFEGLERELELSFR